MGRSPCCEKVGLRRGRWTAEEDEKLKNYVLANGEGLWKSLPKNAGLLRCGKSCRLRWVNYLRSNLKRGKFSAQEDEIIINLHASMGNRWSIIAGLLPGRTDNEVKNYWNSHLCRRIDSYRKPNPNFVPPPTTAAADKAGKRTAAAGSFVKKTKPHKNLNSSNPKPCRRTPTTPTPVHKEEPSSNVSWEENKGENGNASTDSLMPREDPLMELGILCEPGLGVDNRILSLDELLADADGTLPTMEEAKNEKDNRELGIICEPGLGVDSRILSLDELLADADGIFPTMEEAKKEKYNREFTDGEKSGNVPDNTGYLEINIGECWLDVASPVNDRGGVGWNLDWDWGNEEWGQETNTLSPRLRVNSERDSDKYSEMVAWILSQ